MGLSGSLFVARFLFEYLLVVYMFALPSHLFSLLHSLLPHLCFFSPLLNLLFYHQPFGSEQNHSENSCESTSLEELVLLSSSEMDALLQQCWLQSEVTSISSRHHLCNIIHRAPQKKGPSLYHLASTEDLVTDCLMNTSTSLQLCFGCFAKVNIVAAKIVKIFTNWVYLILYYWKDSILEMQISWEQVQGCTVCGGCPHVKDLPKSLLELH